LFNYLQEQNMSSVEKSQLASALTVSAPLVRKRPKTNCPVFAIKEISDLFVDACVQDSEGRLVFLSVYGRDTALNQFYAAMQLGSAEGGIRSFRIQTAPMQQVAVGDVDQLDKHHGRLPATLFGNLTQAFVYQKRVCSIDKSNGVAILLYPVSEARMLLADRAQVDQQLWSLVKQLSPVALMDHWRGALFAECPGLSQSLGEGVYLPIGDISAWRVQLPTTFTKTVSRLIRTGYLTLEQ
jgi:hypothetical protein